MSCEWNISREADVLPKKDDLRRSSDPAQSHPRKARCLYAATGPWRPLCGHTSMLVLLAVLMAFSRLAVGASTFYQEATPSPVQGGSEGSKPEKKKNPEKKSGDKNGKDDSTAAEFSDEVADDMVMRLIDALNQHDPRSLLAAFDQEKMEEYPSFKDQITAFFREHESFNAHSRIVESSGEGEKGTVLVEMQIEGTQREGDARPLHKSEQVQLRMERGSKGWRIVELTPRTLFS